MESTPGPEEIAMPPFSDLLLEHQGMVFSLAWHFLRNRALAEEIAQEVFLQLYRSLDHLESPEHAAFWLRRVTVNRCIGEARRQHRRPELPLEDVAEPEAAPAPGDPLLRERLWRLVASLPPAARMVVILRYQEDLDPREISEVTGMPVNTVKSKLNRALAILRQKAAVSGVEK